MLRGNVRIALVQGLKPFSSLATGLQGESDAVQTRHHFRRSFQQSSH